MVFLLAPAATKQARNTSRASGWACPDFWQIFGKQLFEGECDGPQNSKYPHKYWGFMVGLGGLEPPTSPLSVLRSLVLPPEMQFFFREHGRLRRYPPIRMFLLLDFHIRLHDEDAARGL
jgi:hypothetical protein